MHISDWMPSKTLEEGEPHIHGANGNASDFLSLIVQETSMDGMNPIVNRRGIGTLLAG